jgi:hypothetical protein
VERRRGIGFGLAAAAAAAACAAPASADVKLSSDDTGRVAAYGGVQAWLHRGFSGRTFFRLVVRSNGVTADAPIKLFRNVTAIDLGPGTTPGSVVAVYTRCSGGVFTERCSVYELDLASGRERRVPGLFSRRASASAPTTWGGVYAFGRDPIGFGHTRGSKRFGLFAGTSHARRLGSRSPGGADMDASVVAYWAGRPRNVTQIRLHRLRGRSDCLIDQRREDLGHPRNDNTVTGPVLSGGYVYWVLHGSLGNSPARIRRVPVPAPNCRHAPIEAGGVDLPPGSLAIAVDGAKLYYANARGVFEADLPAFAPA